MFGLPDAWRADGKHWHAYRHNSETDGTVRQVDRWQRLQREPDAVLATPDQVAEWIEQQIITLGARRKVRAIADNEWVEIGDADDLAHLYGENIVIATRGDSIYTDIYHPRHTLELYVEAVTCDDCDQH